jgi:hypothetical protein
MTTVDISQIEHVGVLQAMVMERDEQIAALVAVLNDCVPFIDDAGDIAHFYPDSAATTTCRKAVSAAHALLAKHEAANA